MTNSLIPLDRTRWIALAGVTLLGLSTLLAAAPPVRAASDNTSAATTAALNSLLDQARTARAGSGSGDDFLPPDQAFRFSASADSAQRIHLSWAIAPGYYLYRDRIHVTSNAPAVQIGATEFPPGVVKQDDYFGKQVTYHNALVATVPITRASGGVVPLTVIYQGCAEAGLCYPPVTRTVSIQLPTAGAASSGGSAASAAGTAAAGGAARSAASASTTYVSEQDRLATVIRSGNMLVMLGLFFGLGLGLAFTPCVLPMVPILSGLIAGGGRQVSTGRAFALSLTYVLGMSFTYTLTGAAFAAAGKQVQAAFQAPWIIVLFAALFVAMALSMFGFFTVQMPSFLQTRLAAASNRQQGGSFGGVAVMGALSALIVTTCVAPPLVATLVVIGQSGAIARGAAALFVMSLGMGAPLLVVGSSAGRWLPKAGAWMDTVKQAFGVMMLAVAAWVLTRIVPDKFDLLLFAVPVFAAAIVLWGIAARGMPKILRAPAGQASSTALRPRFGHSLALVAAVLMGLYGATLIVGASRGAVDPLQPLTRAAAAEGLTFRSVSSLAQLDHEVQAAAAQGHPVMLDFYADWCTSCLEMQHYTFPDPSVRAALNGAVLLRADVTANNADDQALLHQFQIYGPPTIAFYDGKGHEQRQFRVVGFMKANQFATLVRQAFTSG
jgi:thiol:disulfide interchange protein DsbD